MRSDVAIIVTAGAVASINIVGLIVSCRSRQNEQEGSVLRGEWPVLLRNLLTLVLVVSVGLAVTAGRLWSTRVPGAPRLALEIVTVFVLDDAFFYWFHRALHGRFLYRRVHEVHHRNARPVPIEYLYAHPVELMGGMLGSSVAIVVLGGVSIVTIWTYFLVRTINELRVHSSSRRSESPGLLDRHLAHHWLRTGNFASLFPVWDRVFGTGVSIGSVDESV